MLRSQRLNPRVLRPRFLAPPLYRMVLAWAPRVWNTPWSHARSLRTVLKCVSMAYGKTGLLWLGGAIKICPAAWSPLLVLTCQAFMFMAGPLKQVTTRAKILILCLLLKLLGNLPPDDWLKKTSKGSSKTPVLVAVLAEGCTPQIPWVLRLKPWEWACPTLQPCPTSIKKKWIAQPNQHGFWWKPLKKIFVHATSLLSSR